MKPQSDAFDFSSYQKQLENSVMRPYIDKASAPSHPEPQMKRRAKLGETKDSQPKQPLSFKTLINTKKMPMKFPIFKEPVVFGPKINEESSLFESNQIEQDQDDDVETDSEVLRSGINQCFKDLRDLKEEIRKPNFRAETSVVEKWRKKGFWFSQDGRKAGCTNNFECKNVF